MTDIDEVIKAFETIYEYCSDQYCCTCELNGYCRPNWGKIVDDLKEVKKKWYSD